MNASRRTFLLPAFVLIVVTPALMIPTASTARAIAPATPATDVCGPVAPGTRWTAAGSPYITTCDVEVPSGAALTLEAGTVVRLGYFHQLNVAGALQVLGSAASPVRFEAADAGQPWGSVQLQAGSGPSRIGHAVFTGGGAGRREMLGIAADQAEIHDSLFTEGAGFGVAIKDDASPNLHDSRFINVTDYNAKPVPAALHILGQSEAVITRNVFQSNTYAVYWEADANPDFEGNRFAYNGHNGVLYRGEITRDVRLPNLGPRAWSYRILPPAVDVESGGSLTIDPGATIKFGTGTDISVKGTLAIRGQATSKVLLTTDSLEPAPGKWSEIEFQADSVDYDPHTGEGSIIDHAIIEFAGARQTGSVYIRNSSPRISNTLIRHSGRRGMTITGEESNPQLVGNLFDANLHDPDGNALFISGSSAPEVSFCIFRNNRTGIRAERGAAPVIQEHNWFDRNLTFGVFNGDRAVCIEAAGNDWGATNGPSDTSALPTDACGAGSNLGDGDLVSNHVRYEPFEGQLARPSFTKPQCGTIRETRPTLEGLAPPGTTVEVYDNQTIVGTTRAETGGGELAPFSFMPRGLDPGSHVLQVRAVSGELASGISEPLELLIDPYVTVDAGGLNVSYDLDDNHYVQPYQNASGCLTLLAGDWMVRHHPVSMLSLSAPIACPSAAPPTASLLYLDERFPLQAKGDGRFEATFDPAEGGPFSLEVNCQGKTQVLLLGSINKELNGFVYDVARGQFEGRIFGATVTMYEWDQPNLGWRIWPAHEYFGQTNPQVTGLGGWFGFYPQAGLYRAEVTHPSYESAISENVTIITEPFVPNIALRPKPRIFLPALRRQ